MCVVQVGTLVLQRSHKYFELEIFQFYKFVLPHWASRPTKLATKQALIFTVITYKSICML